MYKTIINPDTNKKVNINTRLGKQIISKYSIFSQKGGASKSQISEAVILRGIINHDNIDFGNQAGSIDQKLKEVINTLIDENNKKFIIEFINKKNKDLNNPLTSPLTVGSGLRKIRDTLNILTRGESGCGGLIQILNVIIRDYGILNPKNILNLVIHSTDNTFEGSIYRIICNIPGKFTDNIQKLLDLLKLKFAVGKVSPPPPRIPKLKEINEILNKQGLSNLKSVNQNYLTKYFRRTSSNFQEKVETIANFLSDIEKGNVINLKELKQIFINEDLIGDEAWKRFAIRHEHVEEILKQKNKEIKTLTKQLKECQNIDINKIVILLNRYKNNHITSVRGKLEKTLKNRKIGRKASKDEKKAAKEAKNMWKEDIDGKMIKQEEEISKEIEEIETKIKNLLDLFNLKSEKEERGGGK